MRKVFLGLCFVLLSVIAIQTVATAQVALQLNQDEVEVIRLINAYRAQNGLPALVASPTLTNAAGFHSSWMADRNCFSHQCSFEPDLGQRLINARYRWQQAAGENIAAGLSNAQRTFTLWVNSPGHNRNMLDPRWRAVGVKRAYNSQSQYRYYWTVDFGDNVDGNLLSTLGNASPQSLSLGLQVFGNTLQLPSGLNAQDIEVQVFDLAGNVIFSTGKLHPNELRNQYLDARTLQAPNGVYMYVVTVRGEQNRNWRSDVKKLIILN